jgi:hypothetical protein
MRKTISRWKMSTPEKYFTIYYKLIDLITTNQKYSFFGLDLGVSNHLMPHCYSVGNSLSSGFVMLNWVLEASNDLKQWFVIDQRIYFIEKDELFNRK